MKKLIVIVLAFWSIGCGTLKKDKLFSKNITKETLASEIEETHRVQRSINSRDSIDNMMQLTIWPKGPFTFSPSMGFVGEAFKMEVQGKHAHLMQQRDVTLDQGAKSTKQQSQKEIVVKLKEKEVEWEGKGYRAWVLVLAVAVGFWLVWKRLKLG
ncbi:hypothetical protein [Pedobacter frigiditerrae]|uniref:hypothetical protein n=1 Tax=Pedobacter frigiditerrae TaxID=2530452 RepID=UPI00292EDA99|nr:hypothetical protein [Pedobacter frigiditerrae]